MSKPRITAAIRRGEDGVPGEVYLYLNPAGRDLLVQELRGLDEQWDHLHFLPEVWGDGDLPLQLKAYAPEEEEVVHHVKILYRPEAWDEKYFPHVLGDDEPAT